MKKLIKIQLIIALVILISGTTSVYAMNAVASIKRVTGTTLVERGTRKISARTGLILFDRDVIVTHQESKATIVFRDGSTIRLFPNTRFLIEKTSETKTGSRKFINNLMLKVGSFWGKFTKRSIETVVRTPTATAGIKGTTVSFMEKKGKFSVTLDSGRVEIKNDAESVDLTSGQMIRNLAASDTIRDKVESLPYRLTIEPTQKRFELADLNKPITLYFTVQLSDTLLNKNVSRTGEIYIHSADDNLRFEDNINLSDRGYARIKATYQANPKTFRGGQIEIIAIMDNEQAMSVESGKTAITITSEDSGPKRIKIDAGSGSIK